MKKELANVAENNQQKNPKPSNDNQPQGNQNNNNIDKEQKARNDALSGAIVKEKPNIKWNDVAGLDMAK